MSEQANNPSPVQVAPATVHGLSIRVKLAFVISLLVTLSLGLLATFVLMQARKALISETTNRGIIIGRGLADYSNTALLNNDLLNAARFCKDALSNDAMVYAVLTNDRDEIVAAQFSASKKGTASVGQSFTAPEGETIEADNLPGDARISLAPDPETGQSLLTFAFPVIKADVRLGTAHIALSQSKVQAVVTSVTKDVALLVVFFLGVSILASLLLAGLITRPVHRLTQGAAAIGAGNLDTKIAVTSGDEIGALARTFNAMTSSLKTAQEELISNQLLKQELNIAQEIQQGLLPKKVPQIQGYEIAAFYQPAKEVGGDYYDFIRMSENKVAFAVADVSGKSVPGALGMTMARSVLRSQALSNNLPGETLRKTNEVIQPDIRKGMFVTMYYAVLDASKHQIYSGNAGHNPAFLIRGDEAIEVAPEGIALGLVSAQQFYIEEHTLDILPGDLFVLYTDGVTEAMNNASEEWGEERFVASLKKHGRENLEQTVQSVLSDLKAFVAGAPPHDDITLLLIRRAS